MDWGGNQHAITCYSRFFLLRNYVERQYSPLVRNEDDSIRCTNANVADFLFVPSAKLPRFWVSEEHMAYRRWDTSCQKNEQAPFSFWMTGNLWPPNFSIHQLLFQFLQRKSIVLRTKFLLEVSVPAPVPDTEETTGIWPTEGGVSDQGQQVPFPASIRQTSHPGLLTMGLSLSKWGPTENCARNPSYSGNRKHDLE